MTLKTMRIISIIMVIVSLTSIMIFPMIETLAGLITVGLIWLLAEISMVQKIEMGTQQQLVKMMTPKEDVEKVEIVKE